MNFLEPEPTRCFPGSVRRFLLVAVLVLGVAWALPAAASAAPDRHADPHWQPPRLRPRRRRLHGRDVAPKRRGVARSAAVRRPCARSRHPCRHHDRCGGRDPGGSHRPDRAAVRAPSCSSSRRGSTASSTSSTASCTHPSGLSSTSGSRGRLRAAAEFPTAPQGGCLSIDNHRRIPRARQGRRDRERPLRAHVPDERAQPEGPCRRDATRDRDRRALAQEGSLRHRGRADGHRRGRSTSRSRMGPSPASHSYGRLSRPLLNVWPPGGGC